MSAQDDDDDLFFKPVGKSKGNWLLTPCVAATLTTVVTGKSVQVASHDDDVDSGKVNRMYDCTTCPGMMRERPYELR